MLVIQVNKQSDFATKQTKFNMLYERLNMPYARLIKDEKKPFSFN